MKLIYKYINHFLLAAVVFLINNYALTQPLLTPKDSILKLISKAKNDCIKANNYLALGKIFAKESNYENALFNYYKALNFFEKQNTILKIADCKRNISVIKFYQKNFKEADILLNDAIKTYLKTNEYSKLGECFKGLGDNALLQADTPLSINNYEKALYYLAKNKDSIGIASIYGNLSTAYFNNDNLRLNYLLKANSIWEKYEPNHILSIITLGNIGVYYLDKVRYQKPTTRQAFSAIQKNTLLEKGGMYLKKAITLAKQNNDVDNSSYFTGVLAELQAEQGDYKNAYANFHSFFDTYDSIYSQDSKNKLAKIESQKEIDKQANELKLKELVIANQKKQKIFFILGLCILGLFGALFYYQALQRKKTNKKLLQLNTELDEANKTKAKFLGIISHDLRGPVASLVNFLHLQKNNPQLLSTQQKIENETIITNNAETLLENMETMLLWSKSQIKNFSPTIKEVAVNNLFNYVQTFFAYAKNVKLDFSNTDNVVIRTDENYLQTIMQNLTSNAINAIPSNNAHIEWKAFKQSNKTILTITDNGKGLTQNQIEAIETGALHNQSSKHGFGFHIVKDLAASINCIITIDKSYTKGTRFVLTI
jgi:signal transduction histidine kinase